MFCPRCGQQQASTEMRFCSRCGFQLGGVTELLNHDGAPGATIGGEAQSPVASPRRKGVSQGVLLMMLGAVIVPLLGILTNYSHSSKLEVLTALSAVLFFLGGFIRILYALLFEQGAGGKKVLATDAPAELNPGPRVNTLPPPQIIPAATFTPRRSNTAELVRPPSVTEHTTRLLDED